MPPKIIRFASDGRACCAGMGDFVRVMMPSGAFPPGLQPKGAPSMALSFGADGPLFYAKGVADLKQAAPEPNTITIFQLDAADSPYRQALILGPHWSAMGTVALDQPGAVTADYLQYITFYRDSPAVTQRNVGE